MFQQHGLAGLEGASAAAAGEKNTAVEVKRGGGGRDDAALNTSANDVASTATQQAVCVRSGCTDCMRASLRVEDFAGSREPAVVCRCPRRPQRAQVHSATASRRHRRRWMGWDTQDGRIQCNNRTHRFLILRAALALGTPCRPSDSSQCSPPSERYGADHTRASSARLDCAAALIQSIWGRSAPLGARAGGPGRCNRGLKASGGQTGSAEG